MRRARAAGLALDLRLVGLPAPAGGRGNPAQGFTPRPRLRLTPMLRLGLGLHPWALTATATATATLLGRPHRLHRLGHGHGRRGRGWRGRGRSGVRYAHRRRVRRFLPPLCCAASKPRLASRACDSRAALLPVLLTLQVVSHGARCPFRRGLDKSRLHTTTKFSYYGRCH